MGVFSEITKMRLSLSVVFSSVAGYLLGVETVQLKILVLLAVGGYCMVGASNVFNQVIERDLDALMERTKTRPLPSGRVGVKAALFLGGVLTLLGIAILYTINPQTAMFGAISIFMYVSLYTPLKTKTPLSVFVGAFPGAIPFMLGWVAATNDFGIEPGTLFMIQFFWQFPHFWAIGWFLYDDYQRAGFRMLPTGEKNLGTAIQIVFYSIWTVLASLIPVFHVTGSLKLSPFAGAVVLGVGVWLVYYAVRLYRKKTDRAARQLMLVSVSYITLLQVVMVADKFLR
ncbi:MAG TPA: heme o synthase [Flavobacteriaceae bacterium]|nr:heme o synthase [Flavobacteriaceae bacterium]MCB9212284.1 protoheme IX farnesyltransferase [Alteromonas sp.]HPF10337.1 heme o synthase [Flavobacteriaceae bacterium]HQU20401.1 heme o synthase [Flavobacteriaceae bacterium]HQU65739.1 heme o synthase [Flavobacteriaceae bacterium]